MSVCFCACVFVCAFLMVECDQGRMDEFGGIFLCTSGWMERRRRQEKKVRKEMLREHAKDNPGCEKRE